MRIFKILHKKEKITLGLKTTEWVKGKARVPRMGVEAPCWGWDIAREDDDPWGRGGHQGERTAYHPYSNPRRFPTVLLERTRHMINTPIANTAVPLCIRPYSKHFTPITSFNPQNNPIRYTVLSPLSRLGNWGTETLNKWPKVTHLVSGGPGIKTHADRFENLNS